ncbi:autoinducer binding domain-containing protein [Sphingopyxis sp.]|uniref:autoinducer binding domain-containing protein n=1 Tax=Sphingopyxis sp. TaxID=1908224 RepID=UPI0025E0907F|nr:autoinducer binding domain-containing protein [Sphingopyxis sp.]MBK6413237.1 hypothetical protein [Sphingopyxis sp.]
MGFDLFALAFDRRGGGGEGASMLVHNYPDAWANVYVGLISAWHRPDPARYKNP